MDPSTTEKILEEFTIQFTNTLEKELISLRKELIEDIRILKKFYNVSESESI
jgi:hypothetical protein